MTWRVYLTETTTGQLGRALEPASGSWAVELNKPASGSVKVEKAALAGLDRKRVSPWWAGVLFTYQAGEDAPELPWTGGPIVSWPTEDQDVLALDWKDPREILAHRHLEKDYAFRGLSLGTIAWELVRAAQDKPGGRLPIVHGSPYETGSRLNERTYEKWNIANNNVDKRLTEITNVINGPDMMFRPRWANSDHTAVEWAFVHGTSWDPTIAQDSTHVWDTTAPGSQVTAPSVTSNGTSIATRVWGTGAGEGAATTITRADNEDLVRQGLPHLESVISDQDQAKAEPIRQKCLGALADSRLMVDQLSITVEAGADPAPLGTWQVGDRVTVTLGDQWWSIPGGDRDMDIIKASGDLTDTVKIELQEGQWHAAEDLL